MEEKKSGPELGSAIMCEDFAATAAYSRVILVWEILKSKMTNLLFFGVNFTLASFPTSRRHLTCCILIPKNDSKLFETSYQG